MNLFKNFGKKLGKTAKTVTKKSEELVEITKINLAIGNEEDKIKKLLPEIGSELYRKFTAGASLDEPLNEKCIQLKALEDNILLLKERVKSLKDAHSSPDNNIEEANVSLVNDSKSDKE